MSGPGQAGGPGAEGRENEGEVPGQGAFGAASTAPELAPRPLVRDARRIVVTGYADSDNILASVNSGGAQYVLRKPWKNQDLVAMIEHLATQFQRAPWSQPARSA